MRRHLLLGCILLASCNARASLSTTDRAAEEREIRTLGEQHAQAVASKDTSRAADIYADDIVYLPADGAPDRATITPRKATADTVREFISTTVFAQQGGEWRIVATHISLVRPR